MRGGGNPLTTVMPANAGIQRCGAVRGALYRPLKQPVTMRLDADVVAWFKAHADAKGYQTRINAALREYIRTHSGGS